MSTLPKYAFFRGKMVPYSEAKVGVMTHALNYGTAIFGGLRAYWNEEQEQAYLFRPADHFRRLLLSARLMRMEIPYTIEQLIDIAKQVVAAEGHRTDVYVRPLVYLSDELIGVRLHGLTPELTMFCVPFGGYIKNETGAHVTISGWRRIDDNMIPARGKIAGAYVNTAFIKTDAMLAGFDEALVLTQDGHIAEGSAENVFIVRDGTLITPPVTDNILEGITRRTVMELARDLGIPVVERHIDRTEVYIADELFLTGTAAQITAVTRVDHRPVGSGEMGPITARIRELFFRVVRGQEPKYAHWLVPVYEK